MADCITPLPFLRRRHLPFDPGTLAAQIAPALDQGDRAAAAEVWIGFRARAVRMLDRRMIAPAVRDAIILQASNEVRAELLRIRGSVEMGAPPRKAPWVAPSATVLSFPKAGGANG